MTNSGAATTGDATISMRGISMSYGERSVLDRVDLDVRRGEILVLLGGSGSGKSTLLKHVLGLAKPDAGSITIDGVDIMSCSPSQLGAVRRRIGVAFQAAALFNSLTVEDNIALPLRELTRLADSPIKLLNTVLNRESPKIAQITDQLSELTKHADSVIASVEPVVKHVDQAVVNVDNTVVAIREPLTKDLTELESTLQAAHTVLLDVQNVVGSNEADIGETVRNLRSASENVRVLTESVKQRPWSLVRTKQPADRRIPQ